MLWLFNPNSKITQEAFRERLQELINMKYSKLSDRERKMLDAHEKLGIPIFIFTAKDKLSMMPLLDYEKACRNAGCSAEFMEHLGFKLDDYAEWCDVHPEKMKNPD